MLDLRQVFSLTDFLRNHKSMVAMINASVGPIVLTVKGRPALVIHSPESYQQLLDTIQTLQGHPHKMGPE